MLRRIVSLGQPASESDEPMSPSPEDASQSSEPKSAGGLSSVFKGLTGSKKSHPPPPPTQSSSSLPSSQALSPDHIDAASLNPLGLPPNHLETVEQLKNGTTASRIAAANSLRYAIADYPLNPVLEIWYAGKDLIEPGKSTAARHAGWELLTECAKHESSTDLERKESFQTLAAAANPDDFHLQLAAMVDLTKHGRDVSGFDYDLIPLVTRWLQDTYKAVKTARREISTRPGKSTKGKMATSGEDKNFSQLFAFILGVVKFNFMVASDDAVGGLIQGLLEICMNTNAEEDLKFCIAVIDAIVTFGSIPTEKLYSCIQVLSSVYCMVESLGKESWNVLGNICKSHHGQMTIQILLGVLRSYPPDDTGVKDINREVKGALSVLCRLVNKTTGKGYPPVPFAVLVAGLDNVVTHSTSTRVSAAILRLVNVLFDDGDGRMSPMLIDEDWSHVLQVAATSALQGLGPFHKNGSANSSKDSHEKGPDSVSREVQVFVARLQNLIRERRQDFVQRQDCITFFTKVHHVLSDSAVGLVLDYFQEFRCCFPSDLQWEGNLRLVLESFYGDRHRSTLIRLRALQTITEVYDMLDLVGDRVDGNSVSDLIKSILSGISEETDTLLLQETVTFIASVATSADIELFDCIVESLKAILVNDRLRSPISPSSTQASAPSSKSTDHQGYFANQSPSNVVTRGYTQMFMRSMNSDIAKATKTFTALVHIARSPLCEADARLTAMRLLFRLRADWANRIFLTTHTESDGLASYLFRTEASLARKLSEDAAQSARLTRSEQSIPSRGSRGTSFGQGYVQERMQPVRSSTSSKVPGHKYQQLWSLPDPDALPEDPVSIASPVLFSHLTTNLTDHGQESKMAVSALNMTSWFEAIVSLLHNGCEWEVYSFVLVHLPSQLSNHAIFRDAVPQIKDLRKILCEQIRMNSFQDPPGSAGPRRPEVLTCLFHALTMLLSYHQHFPKTDEDEIVRTFIHGLSDRTAICCVHALSICCHELPLSTSKSLVTILQKMSQIITRQGVAVHILEFLACLSRLPALYSNFREDEYRIVFGICFRYLQTVRDNRRSMRPPPATEHITTLSTNSSTPEPTSLPTNPDDLPQYVYALAYHVITFWFLALKLQDRASQVGWIASRLFTDNDGKQTAEEQAQITIDFMQRVAFSDTDDSAEDPAFKDIPQSDIIQKRWIIGNSIVTIQHASESGLAQITKRQPSGTSCFTVRENIRPLPSHQTRGPADNTRDGHYCFIGLGFSSHLLVQLLSSIPQGYDSALRPIPLPDDDVVERAIKVFDRNSTVDGHKVGVIYIGENQTSETEILANVSGSADYVRFLNCLGTLTKLKGAAFNTQGLDREYDSDGQYTFCWRDRVTEMVFHVITQMPTNLEHDPNCINKKRHIGNDFVNIIFNDSGLPFRFDTFPSDFNYVNIVITPESRASFVASREAKTSSPEGDYSSFYKVQVMSKPGFPEISPAAETKMVSLKALPDFIRLLALNASVFSLVWANREGGEHVSSWRNRLREIIRLRERHAPKPAPTPSPPPSSLGGAVVGQQQNLTVDGSRPSSSVRDSFSSLRRSSVATFFTTTSEQTSHRSSVLSTATTDNTEIITLNGTDSLVDSLDFSKWAA